MVSPPELITLFGGFVAPEEFFDNTMISRVKKAGNNTSNQKNNKAARKIPEQILNPKQLNLNNQKKKKDQN